MRKTTTVQTKDQLTVTKFMMIRLLQQLQNGILDPLKCDGCHCGNVSPSDVVVLIDRLIKDLR